jgi:glycosyltransferase involved in cell wall biosynthesis
MDLGGIINHTEQLIGGLSDLGHTVHLKELVWANNANAQRKEAEWSYGPSGIPHHQGKGWNFERRDRIPYKGGANLSSAKQILEGYDLIIWTVPVPSKNRNNLGNNDWPELYNLDPRVKQIAFVHDGNAQKGSSHIVAIQDHLSAIACVHPCALNGASFVDAPRALVLNPQENPVREHMDWEDKAPGFVNMQTFKAWKHVHELVKAIAYMPARQVNEMRDIAGLGIEYRYMTSEDKCKEAYFHTAPDKEFYAERIWDAALANGMTHHDYWDETEVDDWLSRSRILVDPSWSNNYSKIGGHFNRVVVDAMIRGCVPIALSKGMGDELFEAGVNYVEVFPEDPQEYADIIIEAGNMTSIQSRRFIEANREILPLFDRKRIAQQVIDLTHGNAKVEADQGSISDKMQAKVEDIMFNHFGVLI